MMLLTLEKTNLSLDVLFRKKNKKFTHVQSCLCPTLINDYKDGFYYN